MDTGYLTYIDEFFSCQQIEACLQADLVLGETCKSQEPNALIL